MRTLVLLAIFFSVLPATVSAQHRLDQSLLDEIRSIPAIDNHAHVPPQAAPMPERLTDAEPFGTPEFSYPLRLRADNIEWRKVWKVLYGVDVRALDSRTSNELLKRKKALLSQHGTRWPLVVLDKNKIDVMLVNMPALPTREKRFLWVPHANSLLFPFGTSENKRAGDLPKTLAAYEAHVVEQVRKWREGGAVAIKFSTAYQRSLAFEPVSAGEAEAAYARGVTTGEALPEVEYKKLQDHLFRFIARTAGAAGLVVHLHTGIGADPYFSIAGANPLLLESALNDPTLRSTRFVLVHGGWPFDRQAAAMLIKPNTWADFSAHTFLRYPHSLAEMIRTWLEWYPEKVLFGTDAYPEARAPLTSWEEQLVLANDTAREALAIALTGMMADGEITRARASELARMVLRENAMKLYGIKER